MRVRAIAAVAWLGCGSPAAPASPAPPVSVSAPSPPAALAPRPESPPAAITDTLAIDAPACTFESRVLGWRFELWPRLCDDALTHCLLEFASIQSQDMRISPVVGKRPKAFVEVRYRGLELRGFVDLVPVAVHPKTELRMNGFFWPEYLHIDEAKPGRLVVFGDPGPRLKPAAPLRVELGCDEISLSQELYRNFDELEKAFGATTPSHSVALGPGPVVIAGAAGGKPVATLEAEEPHGAYAYQTSGRDRFVITWVDGGYAFGWVRGAKIKEVETGVGHGSSGGGRGFISTPTAWTGLRCDADVPILVRSRDRLFDAGRVLAGKPFSVGDEIAPGLVELELHHQRYTDGGSPPELKVRDDLRLVDDAKLAVERRLLKDCERGVMGEGDSSPPRRR